MSSGHSIAGNCVLRHQAALTLDRGRDGSSTPPCPPSCGESRKEACWCLSRAVSRDRIGSNRNPRSLATLQKTTKALARQIYGGVASRRGGNLMNARGQPLAALTSPEHQHLHAFSPHNGSASTANPAKQATLYQLLGGK